MLLVWVCMVSDVIFLVSDVMVCWMLDISVWLGVFNVVGIGGIVYGIVAGGWLYIYYCGGGGVLMNCVVFGVFGGFGGCGGFGVCCVSVLVFECVICVVCLFIVVVFVRCSLTFFVFEIVVFFLFLVEGFFICKIVML